MSGLFGGWGRRQEPLLDDDALNDGGYGQDYNIGSSRRPPPFAPGSDYGQEDYQPEMGRSSARTTPRDYSPRQQQQQQQQQPVVYPGRNGSPQTIYVNGANNGAGQQPQVVVIRHEHVGAPAPEGVCCALLVFILGFTFPMLWLLACCQLGSPSKSVRFISRLSMIAFVLTATSLGAIIYHELSSTGKWPWEKECFFPWDPKCKYPPV